MGVVSSRKTATGKELDRKGLMEKLTLRKRFEGAVGVINQSVWWKSTSGRGTSQGKAAEWGACLPCHNNNKKEMTVAGREWAGEIEEGNNIQEKMWVRWPWTMWVTVSLFFVWRKIRNHGWVLRKGVTRQLLL